MTFMEEILTQTSTVGYTLSIEPTYENTFYALTAFLIALLLHFYFILRR
jgi:hypothetical protein